MINLNYILLFYFVRIVIAKLKYNDLLFIKIESFIFDTIQDETKQF